MASNVRTGTLLAVLVPLALIAGAGRVEAQGLIWSLPEEGTWVRYEGTYKQTELRPNSTAWPSSGSPPLTLDGARRTAERSLIS